jgi:uncharacterized protein YecE (DUF72 family)
MIKVGCCGYPTSMKKYFDNFYLVELNRTFYEYPRMATVMGWREKAPTDFEFTVKAHQDISHRFKFEIEPSLKAFEQMKQICEALKARILLIQTPGSFRPERLNAAEKFFHKMYRNDLAIVWETRGAAWDTSDARRRLVRALAELNVSHVTDPFKNMPAYTSDITYFRLHGLGKELYYYQYTNDELKQLYELVSPLELEGKQVYILFNNLAMFEDGFRFKHYIEKYSFPSLTGAVGFDSVRSLIEKTRYPIAKHLLLKRLGWRLVELEHDKQTRLNELLRTMAPKSYRSAEEVLQEIKRTQKL